MSSFFKHFRRYEVSLFANWVIATKSADLSRPTQSFDGSVADGSRAAVECLQFVIEHLDLDLMNSRLLIGLGVVAN